MKILIINDDPSTTDLLLLMLTPTQATIQCVDNGMDGLVLIKRTNPDIVLIDLMTLEQDAWIITSQIREFSSVPILILSVFDNPGIVAKTLDMGADDYLIKPVPRETLLAHINNLMRRKKSSGQPTQITVTPQIA